MYAERHSKAKDEGKASSSQSNPDRAIARVIIHAMICKPCYADAKIHPLCLFSCRESLSLQVGSSLDLVLYSQFAVLDLRLFPDPDIVA